MAELPLDLSALLDGERIIMHIAFDPGCLQNDQFAGLDRPFDCAGKPRALRDHRALDLTTFALNDAGASQIAFDCAINMQISRGRNVAFDCDIGTDHGKG